MKSIRVFALVAGLLVPFVLSSPVASQDSNNQDNPSYLFVFEGRNATLRPEGNSRNKFTLTMPLRKADHLVTWFSDRPVRDAGHIDIEKLIQLWKIDANGGFKNDPPNVAVSFGQETLIAEMTNPMIVKNKSHRKYLVSTMTLLGAQSVKKAASGTKAIAAHAKRADGNKPQGSVNLAEISVFVDGCVINQNAWGCQCPGPWNSYCALQ